MISALWWQQLLLVMAGGALGAAGRFWLGDLLLRRIGDGLPWGTLAVNLAGSFAAGFLVVWLESRGPTASHWRAFLLVGVIGALTTFSALMVESLALTKSGRGGQVIVYLGISLILGLAMVWLGSRAATGLRAPF